MHIKMEKTTLMSAMIFYKAIKSAANSCEGSLFDATTWFCFTFYFSKTMWVFINNTWYHLQHCKHCKLCFAFLNFEYYHFIKYIPVLHLRDLCLCHSHIEQRKEFASYSLHVSLIVIRIQLFYPVEILKFPFDLHFSSQHKAIKIIIWK